MPATAPERTGPRIESLEAHGLRWINIEQPGSAELAWVSEHFSFHPLNLDDVRSRNQRPKIDQHDDHMFIVLNFPVYDKSVGRLNAAELDIFVSRDYIITLPNRPLGPVRYLFDRFETRAEDREQSFAKGSGHLLYTILDYSIDYCFPMLRKIGNKLERIEDDVFTSGRSKEVVRDIFQVKQEVINFRKTIRPQRQVLRELERAERRYTQADMEEYFGDIVDASERIWDMLENYKEVMGALEDTNEALLQHRLNDILRILTAISVIVLPLTLIASIWGMNVGVPGEGDDTGFWVILALMIVLLAGMLAYFRYREWL